MSQGRPPACQIAQCDVEMLSNNGGTLHLPELRWPLSELLNGRVGLARIQQKLSNAFFSTLTAEQRLRCVEEADPDLMRWKEGLPFEFRPEQQTILDSDAHIDISMLHLDYFNLLQTIHWTSMNHGPAGDCAAPRLRASESICLGACLALVRTLNSPVNMPCQRNSQILLADVNLMKAWPMGIRVQDPSGMYILLAGLPLFSVLAKNGRSRSDHFLSAMAMIYRDISRNPGRM